MPPGCILTINATSEAGPRIARYWDYSPCDETTSVTGDEFVEQLYTTFVQAVTRQLVSDVPVGAYLSGGMDSGSINAVAVRLNSEDHL